MKPGDSAKAAEHCSALGKVAENAVLAAWESGYALGFNAGRLAGLDEAIEVVNRKPKPDLKPSVEEFSRDNPPF